MNELPPWYSIATVGWATALSAAFGALWHGLWPGGAPNLFAFTALCLLVAFFGVSDTFRSMMERPVDPGWALVQILLGGAALAAMVGLHRIPFLIGGAWVVLLRGQVGAMTARMVELYDRGGPEQARGVRRGFASQALATGMALVLCGLGSNLETSPSLLHWGFGPIAAVAAASSLVLLAGAEHEVMRTRFHGGEVTSEPGFGSGWWGPVSGLIAAIIVVGALVPPLPSFVTLREVGQVVLSVAQHTTHNTGPQNLPPPISGTSHHHKGPVKKSPITRGELGLLMFLLLAATFVAVELVRGLRLARRLGLTLYALLGLYARRARELGAQALVLFVGLYELVRVGLREGDWRGLGRTLHRWWRWLVDLFGWFRFGNVWRRLQPRSAAHPPGASYAAPAGPRTAAGAAWSLPPGDPRRRVREIYREFMQRAREVGLPRRPSQTPAAYRRAVATAEPASAGGLEELTASYEWARFSVHAVTQEHVSAASRGWSTVAAVLDRRPLAADGAGAATGSGAGPAGGGRRAGRAPAGARASEQDQAVEGREHRVTVRRDFVRRRR